MYLIVNLGSLHFLVRAREWQSVLLSVICSVNEIVVSDSLPEFPFLV